MMSHEPKTFLIACSGIGKVHGLIAREAAYHVTDEIAPAGSEILCLGLLVCGDEETTAKLRQGECVTIDGCPKLCAAKSVEAAGGRIASSIRVIDAFKNHKGAKPGTATALSDDGWTIAREIALDVSVRINCGAKKGEPNA